MGTETAMPCPRRFPPPWTVEELDACFVVRDANGQALSYVYFEDEPEPRSADRMIDAALSEVSPMEKHELSKIDSSIMRSKLAAIRSRSGHKHFALTVCQYWSPLAAPGNGAAFLLKRGLAVACRLVEGVGE